jgi:hypothetical protein
MDEEEDDDIFKENSKKGGKGKKKESKSLFADYDEFAHLLEGDLYDGDSESERNTNSEIQPETLDTREVSLRELGLTRKVDTEVAKEQDEIE